MVEEDEYKNQSQLNDDLMRNLKALLHIETAYRRAVALRDSLREVDGKPDLKLQSGKKPLNNCNKIIFCVKSYDLIQNPRGHN